MEKDQLYDFLIKELPKEQIKIDEPMKKHTSFKIGGNADFYVIAKEITQVQKILKLSKQYRVPLTIIGNGSNVLVGDKGIRGIVLKIDVNECEIKREKEHAIVTVGAGIPLGKIAYLLLNEGITGFEFAAGIPGAIGGAIRMNAGAYGDEIKSCINKVVYITLDGVIKECQKEECKFEYRHSIFCDEPYIIIGAELQFNYGNKEEIEKKMNEYAQSRIEKQPLKYPSAGSTFKRGIDFVTAKLIDECGLKGYTVGGAQVSTKHAGFIVNIGDAKAKDVIELVEYIKKTILEKTGKQIELEIELVGEF